MHSGERLREGHRSWQLHCRYGRRGVNARALHTHRALLGYCGLMCVVRLPCDVVEKAICIFYTSCTVRECRGDLHMGRSESMGEPQSTSVLIRVQARGGKFLGPNVEYA